MHLVQRDEGRVELVGDRPVGPLHRTGLDRHLQPLHARAGQDHVLRTVVDLGVVGIERRQENRHADTIVGARHDDDLVRQCRECPDRDRLAGERRSHEAVDAQVAVTGGNRLRERETAIGIRVRRERRSAVDFEYAKRAPDGAACIVLNHAGKGRRAREIPLDAECVELGRRAGVAIERRLDDHVPAHVAHREFGVGVARCRCRHGSPRPDLPHRSGTPTP